MAKGPAVVNYIEIAGEKKHLDALPDIDRKKLAVQLQDQMMRAAGYKKIINDDYK